MLRVLAAAAVLLTLAVPASSQTIQTYSKVRLVYNQREKVKREAARVMLRDDLILVVSRETGVEMKRFRKGDVQSLEVSEGDAPSFSPAPPVPFHESTLPLFLKTGKNYWLVIKTQQDACALELNGSNYSQIVAAIEQYTGKQSARR